MVFMPRPSSPRAPPSQWLSMAKALQYFCLILDSFMGNIFLGSPHQPSQDFLEIQCSLKFFLTNSPFFPLSYQKCYTYIIIWRLFAFRSPCPTQLCPSQAFFRTNFLNIWSLLGTYFSELQSNIGLQFNGDDSSRSIWPQLELLRNWNYLKTDYIFWPFKMAVS